MKHPHPARAAAPALVSARMLRAALVVAFAAVSGCGSGSGGTTTPPPSGGGNGGGAGVPTPGLEATFASIQDNVFTPRCTGCHAGASAPQGLRLDEANSFALLVGVPSTEQPSLQRVEPGDPSNSYLIQKLEGTAAVGGRMPLNGTPLAQADIDVIRQWITDGAQPAPAPVPTAPIRLTSLSPLPNETLAALPASITAVFDREPDASTVNATTFVLDRSGGDGSFAEGNEVAVTAASVAVAAANPTTAVMDLTGVQSADDTYRVRLLGSGASVILDLDANALDGEFSGAFPTGDGTAGGDFVATFVVASAPTLQSIQDQVFTPRCAGCHTGPQSAALPTGMDLTSAAASFASLVGVASVEVPEQNRVEPGDPDASYLIRKLEGTAAVGSQMPLGQAPLDAATIAAIRQWITAGAQQ